MSELTELEKSYSDALLGIDSHSLANEPLAKEINKLSCKEKGKLVDMMCTAADMAFTYLRNKAKNKKTIL